MARNVADVTIRIDDRDRQAIRKWIGNAQALLSLLAFKAPCTREERERVTAFLAAMEEAGAVLWESRDAQDGS